MLTYFNLPQVNHPERLWVLKHLGDYENKTILDLGCGENKTIQNAIGIDIKPGADITGRIDELPFDKNVDTIISRHSFEHLLDPIKTLLEWIRVLKSGGMIIIIIPDHESINTMDSIISNNLHLHAYTAESFKRLIGLFPELKVECSEVVIPNWSFGMIIRRVDEDMEGQSP